MLRAFGVALFIFGTLGFFSFLFELNFFMIFLALIVMAISLYIIKETKKEVDDKNKEVDPINDTVSYQTNKANQANEHKASQQVMSQTYPKLKITIDGKSKITNKNTYTFKVAGVTYEGRQDTIKEIVADWKECNPDDVYYGMKNNEIEFEDDPVYEVDIYSWCDIKLISESDNKYDSNAIKVISDFGTLGYVPADKTLKVKSILEKDYSLNWRLIGGKYKYYDDAEGKVKTKTLTYGVEIYLEY